MTPTTGGAPTPRPTDVPGGMFDPNDPYWSDVPLLQVDTDGGATLIRGDLPDRWRTRLLATPRSQSIPEGAGTFGVITNPDVSTVIAVVPVGEYAIDYRRCIVISIPDALLGGYADATVGDYLDDLRRHQRRIKDLAAAGYVLARRDRTNCELWLAKP